jgi:hypothetical protein
MGAKTRGITTPQLLVIVLAHMAIHLNTWCSSRPAAELKIG